MNFVIGSGPSGVMCSQALLAQGESVTMLDVGRVVDADQLETARILRHGDPDNWDLALVAKLRGPRDLAAAKLKPLFGSSVAYALDALEEFQQDHTKCTLSFARGGLSTVWGAGMLPYDEEDLTGWPLGLSDMEAHYRAVAKFVKVSGDADDLEQIFPYYEPAEPPLRLSRQATFLHERWRRHRRRLVAQGYLFGQSRLAVRTRDEADRPACRYCALCLTGCPYGAIYSASDTLETLLAHPSFEYRSGLRVLRLAEREARVELFCRDMESGGEHRFSAKRVFLGGGVLSTLQIMLASLDDLDVELRMAYPPYVLVPVVSVFSSPRPTEERLHTLAQLFVELRNPRVSPYRVHLSVYSYNEIMRLRLRQVLGSALSRLAPVAERALLGRLVSIQGFFSSRIASGIRVRAAKMADRTVRIQLDGALEPAVTQSIRRLLRHLLANAPRLGLLPLLPAVEIGLPGEGNHSGGTFPMSERPGRFQTDRLGRLPRFRYVHLVDSSVFPSVSSGPPTYTIMANAHRIGTEAAHRTP